MLCKAAVAPFRRAGARQQATRRGPGSFSHRSGAGLRPRPKPEPDCAGREAEPSAGGHGSLRRRPCRTGLAPTAASGPGKPAGQARPHPRNGRTGASAGGLSLRLTRRPVQPGPRAASAADAAGRPFGAVAGVPTKRSGLESPQGTALSDGPAGGRRLSCLALGSAAGPKAARSRQGSSSSPVCRPMRPGNRTPGATGCRRSRHCSLRENRRATGRSAAIPPGAGPAMVSRP